MDQSVIQQGWEPPELFLSNRQNDDQKDLNQPLRGLSDFEWNNVGHIQTATNLTSQAVAVGCEYSQLVFLGREQFSSADFSLNLADTECQFPARDRSAQPDPLPWSSSQSYQELYFGPACHNYAYAGSELPLNATDAGQSSPDVQCFQPNLFPRPQSNTTLSSSLIPYDPNNNASFSALNQPLTACPAPIPQSLENLNTNSKAMPGRCVSCWYLRKKCKTNAGQSRCIYCVKVNLPAQICSRDRLTHHKPFQKWEDKTYETLFTAVLWPESSSQTVELRHYPNGPTLNVGCCEFHVTDKNHVHVLQQDSSGWHSLETTAYCLTNTEIDISSYVQHCTPFSLNEACRRRHPVAIFFQLAAQRFGKTPIIQQCFEMYTNLRLMRIRWQFAGDESLGMAAVKERGSPWYGAKPVPRMIQNQLGHLLELNMIKLDAKVSKGIQDIMEKRQRCMWPVVTLATFFLLHIRELDAGRNIFWSRYIDPFGFWIHPSKPRALIEEATASCNSLLSHFHCVVGRKPLDMNWDHQKSKDLVENDENVVGCMKVLQAYVSKLKDKALIGRKACTLYKDGDPDSVGFTISSLLFESTNEGCVVKGFD